MKYTKFPKIDRKTRLQDGWRWVFHVYDQVLQRNQKVPVERVPAQIRSSQNEEEVAEWCRRQDDAEQSRHRRLEVAQSWRQKHEEKGLLLAAFVERLKKVAPNSWFTSACHLENYVFRFFLVEKQLHNMNDWELYYEEFIVWLGQVKPLKGTKPSLALNTQNNIIVALNQFLAFMEEKRQILRHRRCSPHPNEALPKVSAADLVENHELPALYAALGSLKLLSREAFQICRGTGLRTNEAQGLCLPFVTQGHMDDGEKTGKIHRALADHGLGSYHGYICLESQPALASIRATKSYFDADLKRHVIAGSVPRAPLKCRSEISPKWYRYIPIYDKDTWNTLVDACSRAQAQFEKRVYGDDPYDYLLFDGLTSSAYYNDVVKAYAQTGLRYRCPHKLRHTFLTWFYDKTGEDLFLAEKVAGHRDKKTIEVYSHIREQIGRERVFAQQKSRPLTKVS